MYPHERSLVTRMDGRPFVMLGVDSDDHPETLRSAQARADLNWRSFFDGGFTEGPIATRWGITRWPTSFVIDHRGVIRLRHVGVTDLDDLVERLVGEAERAADGER